MAIKVGNNNFGLDQRNQQAPLWISNCLRAAVFFFGGIGLLISGIPTELISNIHKIAGGAAASFILLFLQSMELLFGINPNAGTTSSDKAEPAPSTDNSNNQTPQ